MINVVGISKDFKDTKALNDVTFCVKNGQTLGLLGENGAGKSTLLRIISTMMEPDDGIVEIDGLSAKNKVSEVRKNIGVLFGNEMGLYDRLTARENLWYFGKLNSMNNKEISNQIENLAQRFGFFEYLDRQVYGLSKGTKQKIAIARAVFHDPNVILFDEPDSGLDFISAKIVFDFLDECKKLNKSIIFSSHSTDNIKDFSDVIVILHKGKVVEMFDVKNYAQGMTKYELNNILYNLICGCDENV